LQVTDPTCSGQAPKCACLSGDSTSPGLRDAVSACSSSAFFRDEVWLLGALGICNTRRNNKGDLKLLQYTHSETEVAKTRCIIFSYHSLDCYGKCSNEARGQLVSKPYLSAPHFLLQHALHATAMICIVFAWLSKNPWQK